MRIDAIDLFCGAGGLSYGLQKAGIRVRAGLDIDPRCQYPFSRNIRGAKFLLGDLTRTPSESLKGFYKARSLKLLVGCAPCQPFSTLRNGINREQNEKWPLLHEFSRLILDLQPDLVSMENVPNLKGEAVYSDFLATLSANGYHCTGRVVDAADFGVPQRRNRLVLLASKRGPIRLLSPEELGVEKTTVRDAIGNLPEIDAGQACPTDPLHKARAFTQINLSRITASRPGGTWEEWPDHLKLACHKKESGQSYKSVYGRLEWDKPSGTITTQSTNYGTGRFGHPTQNRALSLREMAILQSFPESYKFAPESSPYEFLPFGRLIGNAVPVELAYAVGLSINHHITETRGRNAK